MVRGAAPFKSGLPVRIPPRNTDPFRRKTALPRKTTHRRVGESEHTDAILTMVGNIPIGRVATYGQIARLAGVPRNSRQVGSILRSLRSESKIPWFRVVNSKGEISSRGNPDSELYQRRKLDSEGVEFDDRGRVALNSFRWKPE